MDEIDSDDLRVLEEACGVQGLAAVIHALAQDRRNQLKDETRRREIPRP